MNTIMVQRGDGGGGFDGAAQWYGGGGWRLSGNH